MATVAKVVQYRRAFRVSPKIADVLSVCLSHRVNYPGHLPSRFLVKVVTGTYVAVCAINNLLPTSCNSKVPFCSKVLWRKHLQFLRAEGHFYSRMKLVHSDW